MTFRRQLLLSQVPLAVALLLVGVASLRTVRTLGESSRAILAENYRSALAAERMATAIDLLDRAALLRALGLELPQPPSVLQGEFREELRVQSANITEPGEADATRRLRSAWESYQHAYADPVLAGASAGAWVAGLLTRSREAGASAREILAINQAAMVRKSGHASAQATHLLAFMGLVTVASLALGLWASSALTGMTVRPLTALSQAVRRFGEGQVSARAEASGHGEVAALGRELNTMADRLERYQRSTLGELLRAQQATQAAIDALPDPVIVLDQRGAALNLNQAAEALLGLGAGQGIDEPLPALPEPLGARLDAVRAQVIGGEGPYVPRGFEDAVRVESPGGPRRLLPRATALRGAEGAVSGVAIVLQDVTRLARIDELRNDVVATVAHEFRTPLTSLQMAIGLCTGDGSGPLTGEQAELLSGARHDCDRLQVLVDDILDLSRIQAGKIEIAAAPCDAAALLFRSVAGAEPHARARAISLAVEEPAAPLTVRADGERVAVVLDNLLANAVRHSPEGGRIAARVTRQPGSARFEVEDSGPGIPAAHRDHVFERFYQVPGVKRGGLGLGLYISREIVRAHGGAMGVASGEGGGSTFWFTLPLSAVDG